MLKRFKLRRCKPAALIASIDGKRLDWDLVQGNGGLLFLFAALYFERRISGRSVNGWAGETD